MLSYAVVLAGVAVLVMLYRRDRRLLKAQRAKFFDLCLDLFQTYRVTQGGPVYPLLSGRYRDHEVGSSRSSTIWLGARFRCCG